VHHDGLRHVLAAHLSEQNNRPEIVRQVLADALGGRRGRHAHRHGGSQGSPWLDV
jgi:hypothetical protein